MMMCRAYLTPVRGQLSLCIALACCLHLVPAAAAEGEQPPGRFAPTNFPEPSVFTTSKDLYQDNPACRQAKVALWLGHGRFEFSRSLLSPQDSHEDLKQDGAVITIGAAGCRIRIRIERAD